MSRLNRTLLFAILLILLIVPVVWAQQGVTVSVLLQHPDQDGRVISIVGTITAYRERVSSSGNAYTTFNLTDGTSVAIFAWKHQGLQNNLRVRVIGTFAKVKQVGRYTFHNEIQAQRIEKL